MIENIFGYIILIAIFCGGIWAINFKIRELSIFVKKNGWEPVRKNVCGFFALILRFAKYVFIGIAYFAGIIFIPLYFNEMFNSGDYANIFILSYLFLTLLALYYINGIKKKKTKSILVMFSQDFSGLRKGIKEFIKGIGTLAEGLLILTGWLLAIAVGIGIIALCVWLIITLGPLWISTIVLVLIFLVLIKFI